MIHDTWSDIAGAIETELDDALARRDAEEIARRASSLRFTVQETCRDWAARAVVEFDVRLEPDPRNEAYVLWRLGSGSQAGFDRAVRVGPSMCETGELMPSWSREPETAGADRHPLLCYEELREVVMRYLAFDDG